MNIMIHSLHLIKSLKTLKLERLVVPLGLPFTISLSVVRTKMVMVHDNADKDASNNGNIADFRGNPADKSRTGGWLAAGLILGSELSERICVMGISMNLVTYLVGTLHLSATRSANTVSNFMGVLNLLGLLGGFVADARLGRYSTVAVAASICALGVTLLTLTTSIPSMRPPPCNDPRRQQCIEANSGQLAMLYLSLYTIALGGGGIKSNVSGFGSDQFDISDPLEEKNMVYFFNRFYFCISMGSLFAVTVLVYIQDNVGRGWGYGISAGTMLIAVIILLCGTTLYRNRKPQGSPLTVIYRVMFLAFKKRSLLLPAKPSMLNGFSDSEVPHTELFRWIDKAAIPDDDAITNDNRNNHWTVSTVTEVEEVKMVLKLMPIWATSILFWTVYSQMTTFSIEQATFMNRKLGTFLVPSGSMSFFLFITIILFTSLNERVFIPMARKITHKVQGITSLQRAGIGLIFSVVGMVAAGIVEKKRRESYVAHHTIISAFWLVPQFFLVGAGEAFAYVGQLEFFIREAPERMKSLSTGLFLSTLATGYFLSSVLVTLVNKVTKGSWLRSNLNKAKLENFYWMLAILGMFNLLAFIFLAMRHQYKVQHYNGPNGQQQELKHWNGDKFEPKENKVDIEAKVEA